MIKLPNDLQVIALETLGRIAEVLGPLSTAQKALSELEARPNSTVFYSHKAPGFFVFNSQEHYS